MSSLAGQVSVVHERAERWLGVHTAMRNDARTALSALVPQMLEKVQGTRTGVVGLAGAPGSGKSTLARLLTAMLNESGSPTVALSLDDYYLGHKARESLAHTRHELLGQRGVPGTHGWQRLVHDLDCLREGRVDGLKLRVFDKSTDDLAPQTQWRWVDAKPAFVIIEGWCLGAPAQSPASLALAVNDLERRQDRDGAWRLYVNEQLDRYRSDLQQRVDQFWYLSVPGWDCVTDWRWQQEQELARPALCSKNDVVGFLATFERIVLHMQTTADTWADWQLQADRSHCLTVKR